MSIKEQHQDFPNEVPLLPLRNTVIYPNQVQPLAVGRAKSLELLKDISGSKYIALVSQRDGSVEDPQYDDIYPIGILAQVEKSFKMPDDSEHIIIQGICRIRIESLTQTTPYHKSVIEVLFDDEEDSVKLHALSKRCKSLFEEIVSLSPVINQDHQLMIENIQGYGKLADSVASLLNTDTSEKQEILATFEVAERLEKVIGQLNHEIQVLEIENKIQKDVQGELNRTQKEFVLKEQLKAIKRELGEFDDEDDIDEVREAIKAAKLPIDVETVAFKELRRLSQMSQMTGEYGVIRNYLDWLIELPWAKSSKERLDLKIAKKTLDEDHYGLERVKKRIIEFLAVKKMKTDTKGPILCLYGPPGVGKTSLGKSIAKALNREFGRIALGGVSDEAEIRGHRRTYIGAMPGRIIREMKKLGVNNPVIMLDEIDKLGRDFKGDPSSALLEVLDPAQNHTFFDHFLDVDFDLSRVLFISTANRLDTIPAPLLDRMEIINIAGYIEEEKVNIASKYLIPKQINEHGIAAKGLTFPKSTISHMISHYTRESGVRGLEKQIASVVRGVTTTFVVEKTFEKKLTKKRIEHYLGAPKFEYDIKQRVSKTGVVTGMAWTPVGGDILFIEATKMQGKGRLKLTGQLGEVMKESAETAFSLLRSRSKEYGFADNFYENIDIHLHVPAGATPKDGPSAGITMFTALFSIFSNLKVKANVAMTGEITLRGMVLPIGGLKEKVLAAKRAGINTIIAPSKNQRDLDDIPKRHLKGLQFYFVDDIKDVVSLAIDFVDSNVKIKSKSQMKPTTYHHV
jgi:ATP-dependent Lon protease